MVIEPAQQTLPGEGMRNSSPYSAVGSVGNARGDLQRRFKPVRG